MEGAQPVGEFLLVAVNRFRDLFRQPAPRRDNHRDAGGKKLSQDAGELGVIAFRIIKEQADVRSENPANIVLRFQWVGQINYRVRPARGAGSPDAVNRSLTGEG
jgi:hypothetical protein